MEDSSYYCDFQHNQVGLYFTVTTSTKLNGSSLTERENEGTVGGDFQWRGGKKASTYYWSDL
jgi:hypothetical protein